MGDDFDEPHVEVDRDRFDRYLLPDPRNPGTAAIPWTRATTLARTLTDEYTLNQWRLRQVLIGIGQRSDLAALAAATHPDDRKQLDEIGKRAEEVAGASSGANLGRSLHTFSQRLDSHGKLTGPSQYHPYLAAYARALESAGYATTPDLIERIVINPEIKVAGQFDRLLLPSRYPEKRHIVGDLKTAKLDSIKYAWLEISIQLATYAHSTHMWDNSAKRWHAMPDTNLEYAIVMHLPQDLPPDKARCDIYRVDIIKGWECALIAHEVRQRRSASKGYVQLLNPQPTAEKVEEVPLAIDTRECRTVINGEPVGCGKPHPGPGQICNSCAAKLLPYLDGAGEVSIPRGEPAFPATPLDRVLACKSRAELSALWNEGKSAGWWTPDLTIAGKARLSEISS